MLHPNANSFTLTLLIHLLQVIHHLSTLAYDTNSSRVANKTSFYNKSNLFLSFLYVIPDSLLPEVIRIL